MRIYNKILIAAKLLADDSLTKGVNELIDNLM